jgi:hypothetical protein
MPSSYEFITLLHGQDTASHSHFSLLRSLLNCLALVSGSLKTLNTPSTSVGSTSAGSALSQMVIRLSRRLTEYGLLRQLSKRYVHSFSMFVWPVSTDLAGMSGSS